MGDPLREFSGKLAARELEDAVDLSTFAADYLRKGPNNWKIGHHLAPLAPSTQVQPVCRQC